MFIPWIAASKGILPMTRDEAVRILEMPRDQAVETILQLAEKAEKFDQLCADVSPTCPSGMKPPYSKNPGKKRPKKPGRKKGHKGVCRKAPETIDHYKEHCLDTCPDCCNTLNAPIKSHKRTTVDLPPVKPEVTQHTVNGYWCSQCKKIVYPKIADALPNATLGVRLLVVTAWLHYWIGISVHNIVKLLSVLCSFDVSAGGLTQAWCNLAMQLKPIYNEIGDQIKKSAVLHADETGWRISGKTHWLWCFATSKWCYYIIDKSRGSPVIKRVIGKIFEGILICDFFGAYNKIASLAKQRCLFHLFTALEKTDKSNTSSDWKAFRKKLSRLLKDAIRLFVQKLDLEKEVFQRRKMRILIRLDALISGNREDKDVNRIIKRLKRHIDELFTFLEFDNVSPYNNHAEQQMRRPAISRKISQQNRSERAAEAHAIFMSLFRSAELQGLNPVDKVLSDTKVILTAGNKQNAEYKLAA